MHLMGSVNKQFPCWKNFGFRQVLKNTQSSDGGVGGEGEGEGEFWTFSTLLPSSLMLQ